MHVFDHDQALFGGMRATGVERLDKLIDRLGVTGSAVTGGNQHIFLPHITTRHHFGEWLDRIYSTPPWFIADVCQFARTLGLTKEEADNAQDFLNYRSRNLVQIIQQHRGELAITDWARTGELDL